MLPILFTLLICDLSMSEKVLEATEGTGIWSSLCIADVRITDQMDVAPCTDSREDRVVTRHGRKPLWKNTNSYCGNGEKSKWRKCRIFVVSSWIQTCNNGHNEIESRGINNMYYRSVVVPQAFDLRVQLKSVEVGFTCPCFFNCELLLWLGRN